MDKYERCMDTADNIKQPQEENRYKKNNHVTRPMVKLKKKSLEKDGRKRIITWQKLINEH